MEHLFSIILALIIIYIYYCRGEININVIVDKIKKLISNKKKNSAIQDAVNTILETIPKSNDYLNEEGLVHLISDNEKIKKTLEKLIGAKVFFSNGKTRTLITKSSQKIIGLFKNKKNSPEIDQKLIDSILQELKDLENKDET